MKLEKAVIGLELGSTRIKAVLLDEHRLPVAQGSYDWENQWENGVWTYSIDLAKKGTRACFTNLKKDVYDKFNINLTTVGAIGISGMMHGYLPFDKNGNQLCEFRTWRNTMTGEAAEKLSDAFSFNVPQRWSVAHVYQAYLNKEDHVDKIDFMTTLAGYVHYCLTGERVLGVGEASGMFPIDSSTIDYDERMVQIFDQMCDVPWRMRDVFPKVLAAGETAGVLTKEGAAWLDESGMLEPGIPMAPPEGDAGTGMVATNSVRKRTGNVSAGTSDFAMIVIENPIGVHREIDMVTTPSGAGVAMTHCNNFTTDINAWVDLFGEFANLIGADISKERLFEKLFMSALSADKDCGGLLSYNYYSGEGITDVDEGRPLFVRTVDANFNLPNLMRMHLFSAWATLKIGLDILTIDEKVKVDKLYGHGGFFKTPEVGQRMLSAAVSAPVTVMETAGEGGPYGMALLAAYMISKGSKEPLEDYLDEQIFKDAKSSTLMASDEDIKGFNDFLSLYLNAFDIEKTAIKLIP